MRRFFSHIILSVTIVVFCTATVAAQSRHSVWSDKPLMVRDGITNTSYNTFVRGNASFAWTQGTPRAYAYAAGQVTAALIYDFTLVSVTSSTNQMITGRWVVRRNGVVVCNNCIGKAYGLDQAAGASNYFKIYVGTPLAYAEKWHYSGYITNRFDF
jgi:hypothetical protein